MWAVGHMESAVGCLWMQTAGATIRMTAPLLCWRKQLYYRQIPVLSFALLPVEVDTRRRNFRFTVSAPGTYQ